MSGALKFATVAAGLTTFAAGAAYTVKTPQQEFSRNALAEHTGEAQLEPKKKMPSNFLHLTIGGYEWKNSA